MKTKLKVLTGLVLLIFLTASLTLVALAETSDKDEGLFNHDEVGLAPDGVGLLATTFNVVTTTDAVDATPGNGVCVTALAGNVCTLRAAIEEANAFAGDDTIILIAGTYTLTVGQHLLIDSNLTISGDTANNTIIDGNATSRVFRVGFGAQATISNVTITNGNATKGGGIQNQSILLLTDSIVSGNTATTSDGGGIINDSTIANPAVLTVTNSIITGNQAEGGGGIFNQDGTVTINNSTLSLNTSTVPTSSLFAVAIGGGLANSAETTDATITVNQSMITTNTVEGLGGGGISNSADLTHTATVILNKTVVADNTAKEITVVSSSLGLGGGIRNGFFGTATTAKTIMTLNDSTVSGNTAINGGGIVNATTLTAAALTLQVTLNDSTVSGNTTVANSATSVGNGGGLVNVNGTASLVNSTVSGNAANGTNVTTGGFGGGLFNGDLNKATTLWLTNTTISSNTAQVSVKGDGVANVRTTGTTTANFKNSIIAGGCVNANGGTLTSHGNNLDDDNTCNLNQPSDFPNTTNPLLGPLQDNGDDTTPHTETHALLDGSPALGAGDNATCAAAPVSNLDQRGQPRPNPSGSTCDIGAYESTSGGSSGTNVYLPIVIKS